MTEPFVPVNGQPYDCYIQCDASTKVIFSNLDQCDVLRFIQIATKAVVYKDYIEPHTKKVSIVVEAHEEPDGDS